MGVIEDYFAKGYASGYADATDAVRIYINAHSDNLDAEAILHFLDSLRRVNCE